MAPLGGGRRAGQPGRAGADDREPDRPGGPAYGYFSFITGPRVHQARGAFFSEGMVEASLVAGDTGVDRFRLAGPGLAHKLFIREERPGHGNHIGAALGEDFLRLFRRVDPVGGNQRDAQLAHEPLADPGETRAWNHRCNGRYSCLVPADPGIDHATASRGNGQRELLDFAPVLTIVDQVQHRQAVDDNKIVADGLTGPAHDLDRKPHAIGKRSAPSIGTPVGSRNQEFIDQIAFRTHDFDAVIAGFSRQHGAADECPDLRFHAGGA